MPKRGVVRFGKRGKLSPRFIEPFEILERMGTIAYRLALPPCMSGVHDVTPRPKRVYGMCNRMCTKGFLNYFSAIIEFLKVILKEL